MGFVGRLVAFFVTEANQNAVDGFVFYGGLGALAGIPVAFLTWALERATGPEFKALSPKTATAIHAVFALLTWMVAKFVIYLVPDINGAALLMACGYTAGSAEITRGFIDGRVQAGARATYDALTGNGKPAPNDPPKE